MVDGMTAGQHTTARHSLYCPACLASLDETGPDALRCERCGTEYPVREGVPMLGTDRDFYYAEISREAMEDFLERARRGEFASMFEADTGEQPWPFILGSHFDRTRGSWIFTTRLSRHAAGRRALDFGAGWGINAVCLAPHFEEVVAVELSWHRLLNLRLWSDAQRITNITPVCGGDTARLPFPDQYFDLVVLNGVIEWIPVGRRGNPRAHQIAFLKEIARITKRDGEVFLASENRYAYHYWTGRPDDHTNLLFGSLLPRPLANAYSKLRNKRPYQHYTYSAPQYRRLLADAGIHHTEIHGLIPAHRLFHKVFPLSIGRIVDREESRGSPVKDSLLQTRRAARLASALGVRASIQAVKPSYLQRLTRHLDAWRLLPAPLEPEPYKVLATNFSTKVAIRTTDRGSGLLAKIPLTEFKAELQANALSEQERWASSEPVGTYVSPLLCPVVFEGTALSVETLCLHRQIPGQRSDAVYEAVREVLVRFAGCSGSRTVADVFAGEMDQLREYLPSAHASVIDRIVTADCLRSLPTWYQHGDFHWGNLLTRENRQLTQIVDWEWASPDGYPLADFLHLIANHADIGLSRRYVTVLRHFVGGRVPSAQFEGIGQDLLAEVGISRGELPYLVGIYLYHTLYKHWAGSISYGLGRRFLSAHAHAVSEEVCRFAREIL
jgi:SAM-dependent methyltransferase